MEAGTNFRPYWLPQDVNLPGLGRGLVFSLIFHLGLGLWLAEPLISQPTARFAGAQVALQITLKNASQLELASPRPTAKISPALPLPDFGTPTTEEAPLAALPLPAMSEQAYVAPEDVEQMASVADVNELPLPANELTPNGALYLKIMISETGNPDRIDILTSTLPEDYATTLVGSFYQARFNPARMAGLPVRSWRIIEIRFGDNEPPAS